MPGVIPEVGAMFPISKSWMENETDRGQVFLEVMDRGPGIPDDMADKIFEPFFTTQKTGTGLGLYFARELSECNGASLEYRPVPGGGSCFRLCFAPLSMGANVA
ncbi:sensor histidine kinase [Nitrosococcus watsonii]|uniref:sensor histidine kinase n=1 Tax=Nitrosococcus watsonii TaxID=473531 RepID=UPI0022B70A55|nr:sensor histidine kinase [Nitrosococcus watsonii]